MRCRVRINVSFGLAYRLPSPRSSLCSWLLAPRPRIIPPPPSNLTRPGSGFFPLEINPNPVDLGTLAPGRSAQTTITLHNPCPLMVSVDRIETSCQCLRVGPAPARLMPGERAVLAARIDLSSETEFRGGLSITVAGIAASGREVFQTRVNLFVGPVSVQERSGQAAVTGQPNGVE